ncbi:bifunctional transcriptional activator/DNA repair enzyme AdaA [Gorillibacterium timonense]|uniref:bifunctional transcriptional activator/DNA repair enzyme AdaA n=1 Tax=Gorillibacterium timonense TaxID=1689269 RepID=UPI00071C3285|nr:bifunctional transcriptional activator/DNA repair enzyme AdaA [Gorillibacterium timonense]
MTERHTTPTVEQLNAILANDAAYDGTFFYAVKTTGIFCRPSCKSKPPKQENIEIYPSSEEALAARYRPCKRCKPTGKRLPDEEWITVVTDYIDTHYAEPLSLEQLAVLCHGTPYHLHRTFKRVMGITPLAYIQQTRLHNAKRLLISTSNSIAGIGEAVGFRNIPYFITLFKKRTDFTPEEYRRRQHRDETAER